MYSYKVVRLTGASYESENIGKQIIWAMKNKGDGKYGGGKIWSLIEIKFIILKWF